MALLTEGRVRIAARRTADSLQKSFGTVRADAAIDDQDAFDIFLSHSIKDAELVVGTCSVLRQFGHTVYVDWIVDRDLDRKSVSRDTAAHLKKRMKQCKALLYLSTDNSGGSKWMPWELGFFDGHSGGRVAILPVSKDDRDTYAGQEYLSIYPYIDVEKAKNSGKEKLWVNRSSNAYAGFENWIEDGPKTIRKRA